VFPSFAYRFDTKYGSATFSGDTTYSENLITLARSTDVLLHEAVNVRGATNVPAEVLSHILESHVEVQKVGAVAERADAKQLILTHIGDRVTSPLPVQQWESWAAVGYSGTVRVASDLQHFVVSRG
jgi:ribonuclease BN (tRNA processing enzyme)